MPTHGQTAVQPHMTSGSLRHKRPSVHFFPLCFDNISTFVFSPHELPAGSLRQVVLFLNPDFPKFVLQSNTKKNTRFTSHHPSFHSKQGRLYKMSLFTNLPNYVCVSIFSIASISNNPDKVVLNPE